MLKILIVEDEALLAETLRRLIELNPEFQVTAIAADLPSAVAAAEAQRPELALVDLQLANATSGFSVAAKLHDMGVACLLTTAMAPSFPLPDLALGCLEKPFAEEDLLRALREAEDRIRGRSRLIFRSRLPETLELYSDHPAPEEGKPAWIPGLRGRTSLAARLMKLVRRPSSFRSAA